MLNNPRSHGLWEASAPPPPQTVTCAGYHSTDVLVVGGGYTGLSAALHLAEQGVSVVVLEANEIGFGGAGRNVGLINAGMWVMPDDLPDILGPVHGDRLLELLGDAPKLVRSLIKRHKILCELETNGTLHCAVGSKGQAEIEARAAQWSKRGAPVTVLSKSDTERRTGTDAYSGALLDMRAGTLQPLAYARGLAEAAIMAGAKIFTSSAVIKTQQNGSRWTVSTANGTVDANWIVVATDAYSTGPWGQVRTEQVHLPYFNFATVPLDSRLQEIILPGREGCWDTETILSSFRMDAAGRLVFGSVGALRGTGTAVHKAWTRRTLQRLFPDLAHVELEYEWYGNIGMTDNALPRFHRFADRVVGFSGYNGRGIAPGTAFGKVLADHIVGSISEQQLPLPVTDLNAPSWRIPQEFYYEAGAQIAHFAGARF